MTLNSPPRGGSLALSGWLPGFLLGLFTVVISGWRYWIPGLVNDEVATVVAVRRPWASMLTVVTRHADAVHAVYYSMLHVVIDLFGYSPFVVRAPSVLAVGLTATAIYLIGKAFWGPLSGVVASISFAFLPVTTSLAQLARPLPMSMALISWAIVVLIHADRTNSKWWLVGLLSALAIATNIYSILVLVGGLFLVRAWRPFIIALGVAGVAASPVFFLSIKQRWQIGWLEQPTLLELGNGFIEAFLTWSEPQAKIFWCIAFLVALAAALVAAKWNSSFRPLVFVSFWLVFPALALWLAGFITPLYTPRYLGISAPAIALCFGAGMEVTRRLKSGFTIVLAILFLALLGIVSKPALSKMHRIDYQSNSAVVAAEVAKVARPKTAVLYAPGTRYPAYAYPEAFKDLADIGLGVPHYERGGLWEKERPISEYADRVDNYDRAILITRKYDGTSTTPTREILAAHKFVERHRTDVDGWLIITYVVEK